MASKTEILLKHNFALEENKVSIVGNCLSKLKVILEIFIAACLIAAVVIREGL